MLKARTTSPGGREETYEEYIDRVVEDNLAIHVKLNDLADKMDLLHVETLNHADLKRYNKQLAAYHRMKKLVEQAKALHADAGGGQGEERRVAPRCRSAPSTIFALRYQRTQYSPHATLIPCSPGHTLVRGLWRRRR